MTLLFSANQQTISELLSFFKRVAPSSKSHPKTKHVAEQKSSEAEVLTRKQVHVVSLTRDSLISWNNNYIHYSIVLRI